MLPALKATQLYRRQRQRGTRPVYGSPTAFNLNAASDQAAITCSFTSSVGAALALGVVRTNAGAVVDWSGTYDGSTALNKAVSKDKIHISSVSVFAFWLKGLATGVAKNWVFTPTDNVRDYCILIADVTNMADLAVGGTFSDATETTAATTTIAGTIQPQSKRSQLIAWGGLSNGASDPFTTGAPWAEISEQQSGTGTDKADIACVFAKLDNSALDAVAFSSVSAGATPASFMGIGMLELLPG